MPVWWSTMPTTMNAIALNRAWAISRTMPACVAAGVPAPNRTTRKPSWLTVPWASSSLRSCWRRARSPPAIIVTRPTVSTSGRHGAISGEHRGEAAEQVDAGLDHRRRVQVGAHRRRRGHRRRQPRVERVLRRLGERPDRPRTPDPTVTAVPARRVGEDLRHLERAGGVADEDETGEHHETAGRRDEQRLQRRGAGGRAVCAGRRSAGTT